MRTAVRLAISALAMLTSVLVPTPRAWAQG